MEGEQRVTMEIPASTEDHMAVTPPRGNFSSHASPLVQLPSTTDISIHPMLGGHGDTSSPLDYGSNALFWRTSMCQAIVEFGVIRPSPGNPPLGEEEQRRINACLDQAHKFFERIERIIPPSMSRYETLQERLPRNIDPWPEAEIKPSSKGHPTYGENSRNPWPEGYRSLAQVLGPIEEIPFQGNPCLNHNPTVSHPRPITRPSIPVMVVGQSSNQVVLVNSHAKGKPPT